MKIIVVGGGPRGIAVALYALSKGASITVVDPHPLSSWEYPNILPKLEMRSPMRFDLVNYVPELAAYALTTYLEHQVPYTEEQAELESYYPVQREQFIQYLQWCWQCLSGEIEVLKESVLSLTNKSITTVEGTKLEGDAVILAPGTTTITPEWLKKSSFNQLIMPLQEALTSNLTNKRLAVIGSGQGAAELVVELGQHNSVFWCQKHTPKTSQFPAPSYQEWGHASALSPYYSQLRSWERRLTYLMQVKQWQPSITPLVKQKLESTLYTVQKLESSLDLVVDHVVLAAGIKGRLEALPLMPSVRRNDYLSDFPDLANFCMSNGIYITGPLATAYDGPRQASLISAGPTAKTIVEDIYARSI